ncbi:MAG: hypothetical protein MJA30_24955 [Cytophagales bacterium]|nr:hypothetical protein [Cytophagales bacterium]
MESEIKNYNLAEKAKVFLALINLHKGNGLRMKDIASSLDINPSVLSSLSRTVLPCLLELCSKGEFEETYADQAFDMVNNLSKAKTLAKMDDYIDRLKSLDPKENYVRNDVFKAFRDIIGESYGYLEEHLMGLYRCYTLSSVDFRIKEEPLLIAPDASNRIVQVHKGNKHSVFPLKGIVFLNGSHTVNMHLHDADDSFQESAMIQLIQPFVRNPKILRGIYLTLSYSRHPIARRIVLYRTSTDCTLSAFEEVETTYHDKEEPGGVMKEIHDYLHDPKGVIECLPVLRPSFDETDLIAESKMLEIP